MVYDTLCKTNIHGFDVDLLEHYHEEADTLIILHALDVAKRDPFSSLTVFSPDTDVFLLLLYFYQSLCNVTLFQTGTKNNVRIINVGSVFEALGEKKTKAILGFYAFTGCDLPAKFNGK